MRVRSKYLNVIKPLAYYLSINVIVIIICSIISYMYTLLMGGFYGEYDYKVDVFSGHKEYYYLIINCIVIFIYYKWYRRLKENHDLITGRNWSFFDKIGLVLCGIGKTLLTFGVMNLLFILILKDSPIFLKEYNNMPNLTISILGVANTIVTTPISEELVFRGVILKKAEQVMPFYAANILQSVLFALVHGNLIMMVYTFPAGLLYGYVTARYKLLLPSVFIHVLHNAIVTIIAFITKNQEVQNISTIFWLLITIIGFCFVYVFMYKAKKNNT